MRGRVRVIANVDTCREEPITMEISQENEEDKEEQVYLRHGFGVAGNLTLEVVLTPMESFTVPLNIAADAVHIESLSNTTNALPPCQAFSSNSSATSTISIATASAISLPSLSASPLSTSPLSTGAKAGIGIGVAAAVTLILLSIFALWRRHKCTITRSATGDLFWSGKPELAADGADKHNTVPKKTDLKLGNLV
ncbi:hypothetical protein K469DRAFT_783281 [Zopfia rhizophila CBS 207.26]|uniref:Mid2 domain-containing protein n=1 Tax=Zopfia rhizophila CBS 207.26 TaxID=1314779 RepID=A0A6A6ETG2_9PEZI|nr:hypothetical protein K469DRAFT_783281 [Zopfia rhizophila CBS 207.26]